MPALKGTHPTPAANTGTHRHSYPETEPRFSKHRIGRSGPGAAQLSQHCHVPPLLQPFGAPPRGPVPTCQYIVKLADRFRAFRVADVKVNCFTWSCGS